MRGRKPLTAPDTGAHLAPRAFITIFPPARPVTSVARFLFVERQSESEDWRESEDSLHAREPWQRGYSDCGRGGGGGGGAVAKLLKKD